MMRKLFFILLLFFIIIRPADPELHQKDVTMHLNELPREDVDRIFFSDSLVIDTQIHSSATILREFPTSRIEYVTANLSFFPKETFTQDVISLESTPTPQFKDNSVLSYRWETPEDKIDFDVKAQVRTRNVATQMKEKIPFPIQNLLKDLEQYTRPSEKADINPSIINQANVLAEGEDDLFQVVFNLAQWTKTNIEYNLSTVTAEAAQKSSWVFDNRQGVCDELTVLFISMARSLGIPARFISGIAYTNSELFPERWGPHGWAEVYFPGYGWIPFDVTYGEFGYIDASHIVSKIGLDPSEPSISYQWLGKEVQLNPGDIGTKAQIVSYGNEIAPSISLEFKPMFNNVGFGSYNLLQATTHNLEDYYVAADVFLSKVNGLSVFGDIEQPILLRPKEERNLFWIVKVDENLDPGFFYNFPISAYTYENIKAESSFQAASDEIVHSRSEIYSLLASLMEEREKTYSKNVQIDCSTPKKQYYTGESIGINCSIRNTGNVALADLSLCIGLQCRSLDLGISQQKNVVSSVIFKDQRESISVLLKSNDVTKVLNLPVSVLERPKIKLSDISHPDEVEYSDSFQIRFTASKTSKADPQNIRIDVRQNRIGTEFSVPDLSESKEFVLDYTGSDLDFVNKFNITANYEDLDKNKYSESKTFEIRLKNLTFMQKIAVYINRIGRLFR